MRNNGYLTEKDLIVKEKQDLYREAMELHKRFPDVSIKEAKDIIEIANQIN